jgi:hypothetical protein
MLRNALPGALLLLALAAQAPAQTVDDLVAQLAQARGGLEKLRSVQSLRMLGHMMLGPNAEAPVTIERKRPHSTRAELTLQGRTSVQAYDGQKAWGILPGDEKAEPLPPEMARDIGNQADIDGPLVDYKEKGNALELIGKEKTDDAEVWRIKVTLKSGDVLFVLLDTTSHLEVGNETKRVVRGSEVEIATRMSGYKPVGGVLWPHTIDSGPKGRTLRPSLVIDKIEVNPEVDDARFKMPLR